MKNTFETKDQYLKMRAAWAQYFNTEARNLERNEYGNRQKKLRLATFIIYAILRGKDWKQCCESASADTMNWTKIHFNSKYYRDELRIPFGETTTNEQFDEAIATFQKEVA